MRLVEEFIPTLLSYLAGKVRGRSGKRTEREGGNLQLEFNVLSKWVLYGASLFCFMSSSIIYLWLCV